MAEKYMAQHNEEEMVRLKTQDEIDTENNANTLLNAADVAIATKNPYAVAIGAAVKAADKLTKGESTQILGETMTEANKSSPGGKSIQKLSNKLSESGSGDKIGKAASYVGAKNSNGGSAAGNAANNASNVANTASNAPKTPNAPATSNTSTTPGNPNTPKFSDYQKTSDTSQPANVPQNNKNLKLQDKDTTEIENPKTDEKQKEATSDENATRLARENRGANNPYTTKPENKGKFRRLIIKGAFTPAKIMKYWPIISVLIVFIFVVFFFVIVAGNQLGNFDLTNNSTAMGNYSPELIGTVTPGSISEIDGTSIDGGSGGILSGGNTLYSIMGEEGVNLLNETIKNSAQSAGYGTGAAPAAAAQALIQNLLTQNIILPYFWGGGHGTISTGASGNWGSYTYVGAGGHSTSFSKQPLGLDCSGFVSWALYNGGCTNFSPRTAANFKSLGPSTSFSNAKTGDIAASNSHVVLILENRGSTLLVAEAKGTAYGVVFSERSARNLGNYKIVDMSSYYQTYCS